MTSTIKKATRIKSLARRVKRDACRTDPADLIKRHRSCFAISIRTAQRDLHDACDLLRDQEWERERERTACIARWVS